MIRGKSWLVGACLATVLLASRAPADTITANKMISFTWNPKVAAVPGVGSATWGTNSASDRNVNQAIAKGPTSAAFALNLAAASLAPTKKETATAGAAKAEVEIGVGKVVAAPAGAIQVDGAINVDLVTPGGKGGTASGAGRINLNGSTKVAGGLKVNGKAVAANMLARTLNNLRTSKTLFLDPLHLTLTPEGSSTPDLDADLFQFGGQTSFGGAIGDDGSGQFSLAIVDDPSFAASASIASATLVPWATDLTGTATLVDGVFTSTGIFAGTGLWSLTSSATDPGYIVKATLLDPSLLTFSLDFEAPVSSSVDHDFDFSGGLTVSLETVPEPEALLMTGLGLLGLSACRSRRSRPGAVRA